MAVSAAYSRPVSRALGSPRVYYMLSIVALAITGALVPGAARAQVDLTAPPSMVKGPPDAPVTIVEFSDYQ